MKFNVDLNYIPEPINVYVFYYVVQRSIACWCIGYHGCRQWDVVGSGCACDNITHNHRCMITS